MFPGHENHGVHVCHKCGWAFPNPHPSAKQRRAHKKVCGKVEGFNLIESEDKSHSRSDSDLSDDDHKQSKSVMQGSGEKVSGIVGEGSTRSEGVTSSAAVTELPDTKSHHIVEDVAVGTQETNANAQGMADAVHHLPADAILQPNILASDAQIQNVHALESKPHELDNAPHHDHALNSTPDTTGTSALVEKTDLAVKQIQATAKDHFILSSVHPLKPETLADDSRERQKLCSGEDVNSSIPVIDRDADTEGTGESTEDKTFSTTLMSPVTEVEIPSELTNVCVLATSDGSSMVAVDDLKIPDTKIFHANEKPATELTQQYSLSEISSNTPSGHVEVDALEHMEACVDTSEVLIGSLQSNSRVEVDGTIGDNKPFSSTLEDVPAGKTSEMNVPLEAEEILTSPSAEELENKVHCLDPVVDEVPSGIMPIGSGESADILFTTIQGREDKPKIDEPAGKITSEEFMVDESGQNEDGNDKGSQAIGSLTTTQEQKKKPKIDEPAGKITAEEFSVDRSGQNEDHNDKGSQSIGIYASGNTKSDDVVVCSSEIYAIESHFEDNKPTSSLEQGPDGFVHEVLPETPIAPVAGVGIISFAAGAEDLQEILKESDYGVVHQGNGADQTLVGNNHEEGSNDQNSSYSTKITPESEINVTDMKPQFYEDSGINNVDEVAAATHTDTLAGSKGTDTSSISEVLSNNFIDRQKLHNEVTQEFSKEPVAYTSVGPSIVQTEKVIEGIETDNSSLIERDQSCEVFCHTDSQNPMPEEPVVVAEESCNQTPFSLVNRKIEDLINGDASEDGNAILKQGTSCASDSNSQTDSVEGHCGSVSDATVPSSRYASETTPILFSEGLKIVDVEPSKEGSATSLLEQSPHHQHCGDNADAFKSPSAEIQSAQNPQRESGSLPSLTSVINESEGRHKNEEIIEKVANWSPGKPHTPLRSFLVDENAEEEQKDSLNARDRSSLKTHENQARDAVVAPAKTIAEVSTELAAMEAKEEEWSSPEQMPIIKREKKKVRGYWMIPFVCCASNH